jgi:hypothetical protein
MIKTSINKTNVHPSLTYFSSVAYVLHCATPSGSAFVTSSLLTLLISLLIFFG